VNLQHLKHFVAVAEELHFGRAAERVGMAQPPLSQSIRRLEESLGARLFLRTQRRVQLTAAGEMLLSHAREILGHVEYAEKAVISAKSSRITRISMGFTPNALSNCVPSAVRELQNRIPDLDIVLTEATTTEQIERLLSGKLDIGFFHPPEPEINGLDVRVVERSIQVAAIPQEWPLAKKPRLEMADLHDQPVMVFPAHLRPARHFAFVTAFRNAGSHPQFRETAMFDQARLQLAAAGMGIALIAESAARQGYPGVIIRRIEDLPTDLVSELGVAWRRNASPPVRKLMEATYEAIKRA